MKVVDEDGNLFGKINVIDAFVVLLVAAIIISGISLVWTGDSEADESGATTKAPEMEDTETTVLFRTTGHPEYVVDAIERGQIPRPEVVSVEGIAVNQTSNGATVFLRLRLNTTANSNSSTMWQAERLFVGRTMTVDLQSLRLEGTVIDTGESASLPAVATPTPTANPGPTPTPTAGPNESRLVIQVRTTAPKYVGDAIGEGNVSASPDIIAVREKTAVLENESQNRYRIELRVEVVVTEDENKQFVYRDERLYVGRNLRLDLGETIIKATVTDIQTQ